MSRTAVGGGRDLQFEERAGGAGAVLTLARDQFAQACLGKIGITAHVGTVGPSDDVDMRTTVNPSTTAVFLVQSAISFGVSLAACMIGIAYLPVGGWTRAFLGIALLYAVTSTFTLAKCVRDRQEQATITDRVDQARLDKLLAEHDPFKVDT